MAEMTTSTERLRKLLDERGIEWSSEIKGLPFFGSFFGVTFVGDWYFCEYATGELSATCRPVLTPEQAISATLGNERERALEKLVQSLYADYQTEWPDRAEDVYAELMNALGIEVEP